MAINLALVKRYEKACAGEAATRVQKKEQEAARRAYIRMLRDVARALEADPSAFHGAAVQVRDTSAVVVDAFEKGGA